MFEKAECNLTEWKPVKDRMTNAHFKRKFRNILVTSVYIPILCANNCDKNKFYAGLQYLPKNDKAIIRGNWNARIGHDTTIKNSVIGKYGNGDRCANGKRLLYFAEQHEFLSLTHSSSAERELRGVIWINNPISILF